VTYRYLVLPGYRFATAPKWVAGHLLVLALAVTMILLGRWQLDVSNSKHFSLQNFGYALQWWAFSVFVFALWLRILRDRARNRQPEPMVVQQAEATAAAAAPVAYRRYVMPQSADGAPPAHDPTHAAYNDYLAALARDDRASSAEKEN
jgi:DNA-binding transcriptional regulator of glucitol operon